MTTKKDEESFNNPEVEVRAEPPYRRGGPEPDWDYCDKVAHEAKKTVREAIKEAEGEGVGGQTAAAMDAVEEAGRKANPDKIERIHVEIDDDDDRHLEIDRKATGEDR